MDLSLKKRTSSISPSSSSPSKKDKGNEHETLSSSDSDSSILNIQEVVEEEQLLWQDESWISNLQITDDSGIRIFEPRGSTSPSTSSPKAKETNPSALLSQSQEGLFNEKTTKQAAILNYIEKVVIHMDKVGERALEGKLDDLWAFSIENRATMDALCNALKVRKASFTNLEGIIALYEKLKEKSIEEKLEENKKKIPEARAQVMKLKEVLVDIHSDSSLLKNHRLEEASKCVPERLPSDTSYEPYRANSIIIQPKFGESELPVWVVEYINNLNSQIICADSYFETGLRIYFKSIEAAKSNFLKMCNNERFIKEKIYLGRPSRGGKENKWEDLQFMARVKVITADFKKAWYQDEYDPTTKENKKVLKKAEFLEFFFRKNNFLTKQDWIYSRTKDSSSISTIYFEVALRTFDALKKYDSRNVLTLKIFEDAPGERVLGVYSLVLCHSCLEHGHYFYDCKKPTRCIKCSSIEHGNTLCKKSDTCPHCLRTYPPEANHSATDYTCPAYQEKGYKLQKAVKNYLGGY